ncbi:MAG: type I 3-dehydroquinate dehydratase [Agathobacter sp.]|nr:type I 3-dehydroquinate dehydratase [Agathobacter sp.]
MQVKGPLICVPIMAANKNSILTEASCLVEQKVPMIEWRMDAFDGILELEAVIEMLKELREATPNTLLLATYRSRMQGGLLQLKEAYVMELQKEIAKSNFADYIDVEYLPWDGLQDHIKTLKQYSAKIIISYHDFEKTPSDVEMRELFANMAETDADIMKLAVMPRDQKDVQRLLDITKQTREEYPKKELITMSMGELGMVSRIEGFRYGSCVTFGAGAMASAPGQIPFQELKKRIEGEQ